MFADGSSWLDVIARLQAKSLRATAVQNPLTSLPVFLCVPSCTVVDLAESLRKRCRDVHFRKAIRVDFDRLPHRSASHDRGRIGHGAKQP